MVTKAQAFYISLYRKKIILKILHDHEEKTYFLTKRFACSK